MAFFIFQESDQFRTDQVAAPVAAAAVHQGPADIAAGLAVADNIAVDNMAAGKAGFRIAAHAPLLQADLLAVFLARAPKALGMVAWVVAPVAAAPAVVLPPVVMDSSAPWAPQGPVVLAAHALLAVAHAPVVLGARAPVVLGAHVRGALAARAPAVRVPVVLVVSVAVNLIFLRRRKILMLPA
ncbi:MAG: hypothetical protein EBQ89_05170 [Alphaproteobacteria bacterium]|nr:hypothetical protein [Alphaproteobacteria bacterium]